MTQEISEAAAAAIVEGQRAVANLDGLMSDVPRKNAWTLAEYAGDRTPDRMQ